MSKKEDKAEKLEKIVEYMLDEYVYIKYMARFYWVQKKVFYKSSDAAANLLISPSDLIELRENWVIKDYDNICYVKGSKPGCYNLLDENSILKPSDTPNLDPSIQELIENVCGHKSVNIEWLYKAILYKYTHINDSTIPAVVFFWKWGSGKWTFISLLGTIFWEQNMMSNLGQRELTSQFDTYKWQKLIIEFAEVISGNTHSDKLILNKLKNIVGAEMITVNEKGVQPYQIENIVWVFISSNSNLPLLLDDKDKGNRRFTLLRSDTDIKKHGKKINEVIRDRKKVANFLAWLFKKYPNVQNLESLEALDNQEKKDLEWISQSDSSHFWEWFEQKYPKISGKVLKSEIDTKISDYCFSQEMIDERTFKRWFWKTSKYPYRRLRYEWELKYCVEIPKRAEHMEHLEVS